MRFKLPFSERQKPPPELLTEKIAPPLRNQIIHIWDETSSCLPLGTWQGLEKQIAKEAGLMGLGYGADPFERIASYFQQCPSHEMAVDVFETVFSEFHSLSKSKQTYPAHQTAITEALAELNARLRHHGIAYRFEDGQIFKVSDDYVHREVTLPALNLLGTSGFEAARDEFLSAHKHFKEGSFREAATIAGHSFESTLKSICKERKISVDAKATVKHLVPAIKNAGLLDNRSGYPVEQIATILQSTITIRNTEGVGHGRGPDGIEVPERLAAYTLHNAAAAIVFLIRSHKEVD